MIIESQDKMEIFNFDEIFRLYVDNWSNEEFATEPNCFCIKAEKSSDNMICAFLGEYKTEERAKEILKEMVRKYELGTNKIKIKNSRGAEIVERNIIYEMPKELIR